MKIGKIIAAMIILAMSAGLATADRQPGAVMAVDQNGADDKLYPTTQVYIKGVNLLPNTPFSWDIYDKDVTCPPETNYRRDIGCAKLLHSGSGGVTSSDGSITPYQDTGWAIPNGDNAGHPYKLVVTLGPTDQSLRPRPAEFYTKIDSFAPVPELATIALTSIGLLGIFLVSRRHRK